MNARREAGPRLGRGLAALLGDAAVQAPPQGAIVRQVPLDLLEPNPFQPRSSIDPAALEELAQSIRLRGILQPLLVRPHPATDGRYQIVAGERRWRAAGAAGLHEVPALVNEMTDNEAAAVALVENLQRQDLNAMDEAEGYARLLTQFEFTQEALGQAIGKSRSHVANTLRLLNLSDGVKEALRKGEISAGHARALLAHPLPDSALREVIDRQLSVRQTEALATRDPPAKSATGDDLRRSRGLDAAALERSLSEQLGLVVKVMFNGRRGVIQFHYTDLDQLDNLLSRFGIQQ
jgi:ParB family chromosome partitioning protein